MTKEVQVLKTLRKMKGISQEQYRIQHIASSYGMEMSEFSRLMVEEILREEVLESCLLKMRSLSEDKLKLVQA